MREKASSYPPSLSLQGQYRYDCCHFETIVICVPMPRQFEHDTPERRQQAYLGRTSSILLTCQPIYNLFLVIVSSKDEEIVLFYIAIWSYNGERHVSCDLC